MQLPDNESRLSAIVQSSQDAIISKDLKGIITSWNTAAEKIFEYSAQEAVGQHISIIIPEDLIEEEAMIINRVKSGERIDHYPTLRKTKSGRRVPIALSVSSIVDLNGEIIGVSKIARDISEQAISEEKQARLAAIIDSSDDAIISKDLNGVIKSWNPGAQRIFGYTEEEAIGKHITLIIPPELRDEETVIIGKIRKGEKVSHFDTLRVSKTGKMIHISLTVSPVRDRNGKIIGASKIGRDITERVELEQQRKMLTQRLQELNNYKDEFMAMASHELKTPLTVVKANLQILEQKLHTDSRVNFVDKALRQVNKLSDLISDLLDVSKIQSGKLELNKTTFDLIPFLKDITDSIQPTIAEHMIHFTYTRGEKIMVTADEERMEQVVINILTNAVKYSPSAKKVELEVAVRDGNAVVTIKDEGIGIADDDLDKIFTRFFRVRGLASTFSGSGIGLYISAEIIKRHDGDIGVESEPGKGSTFYFSIPLAK